MRDFGALSSEVVTDIEVLVASCNLFEGMLPDAVNSDLHTLHLSSAADRSGGLTWGSLQPLCYPKGPEP